MATSNPATSEPLQDFSGPRITLKHGVSGLEIPQVGFGTYLIKKETELDSSLRAALHSGYRLIDTAAAYGNEEYIGRTLKSIFDDASSPLKLKRSDLFITSKLPPNSMVSAKAALECVQKSLEDLKTDYIDLYLIHWPGSAGLRPFDKLNQQKRKDVWQQLEKLFHDGKLRAIGISNFTVAHIEELMQYASVKPALLQSEYHPFLAAKQGPIIDCCKKNGIVFQAYSSLGTSDPQAHNQLLTNSKVKEIASAHKHSKPGPPVAPVPPALAPAPAPAPAAGSAASTSASTSSSTTAPKPNSSSQSGANAETVDPMAVTGAQVLLKYVVQQGYGIVPKSTMPEHIASNLHLFDFDLTEAENNKLFELSKEHEGDEHFCWNPDMVV